MKNATFSYEDRIMHKLVTSWIADRAAEQQPRVCPSPEGIAWVQPRRGPLWRSLSKLHMCVVFDPAPSRGDAFPGEVPADICVKRTMHTIIHGMCRGAFIWTLYVEN